MDDTLQRVFSILISVLILFILPLYITFEKIDDISYSLALKITSNFVDNVTAKGYISEEMYNDFVSELAVTGNVYDIKMEHVSKKYNPVYYIYDNNGKVLANLDYALYANSVNNATDNTLKTNYGIEYLLSHTDAEGNKVSNIKLSYGMSEIKYSEKQILNILENDDQTLPYSKMSILEYKAKNKDNISLKPCMYANYKLNDSGDDMVIDNDNKIYTMNKGDEFSVRIKNENVTIATVLFNAFTLGIGGTENNTRVYINYGGTIQEEEYKNLDNITN